MSTNKSVCSKMWTDLYINFQEKTLNHCCKQKRYPMSLEQVKSLESGVFTQNPIHLNDRKTALDGALPKNCQFCIDNAPNNIMKVWNQWNDDAVNHLKPNLLTAIHTNYIELDIGNKCDMACVYCGADSSSTWAKELGIKQYSNNDEYGIEWRDAILNQLSSFLEQLDINSTVTFNILGGEPLLLSDTYQMIEYLGKACVRFSNKPTLMVTTNLNCKPKLMKRLLDVIKSTSSIFRWVISVSVEDVGSKSEMVRYHLDWNRFLKNLGAIKDTVDFIYLTITVNLLSIVSLDEFFKWAFKELAPEKYSKTWDFTLNNVQGGFVDSEYCPPDLVDVDEIIQVYKSLITHESNPRKVFEVQQHLSNLKTGLGKRKPTTAFFKFWDRRNEKRNVDYYQIHPLDVLAERYQNDNV